MESHFEPMEVPDWQNVESLDELAPAIERYNSLVGLGRYDDACELFSARMDHATLYRLAAFRERIEWLESLFPDGTNSDPALSDEAGISWTLVGLAISYEFSGAPGRAVPFYRRGARLRDRRHDDSNFAAVLSNLGDCLMQIGGFREAEVALRQALLLNRQEKDEFNEAVQLYFIGRLVTNSGDQSRSQKALQRSLRMLEETNALQMQGVAAAHLAERSILIGDFERAKEQADNAWRLADCDRMERDYIRAALFQGQAALGLGDVTLAGERLHHALGRARAVSLVEYELPALVSLAKLVLVQGDIALAREHLDDVWDPAERGPYPIQQCDAFNVLADIERAEGNTDAAIDAATKAYRAAWCDGPPYAYHWGLEAAKAHLDALGAAYPDMPPFDESKFEPLPDVEITPKDEV